MSVGLIIDIAILALIVISVIVGAMRGLFKTVIAVVITIVSIIGAIILSGILVEPATNFVYPKVQDRMEELVNEPSLHLNLGAILSNTTNRKLEDFMEYELTDDYFESGLPEDVLKIAQQFGLDEEDIREPLEKGLKQAQELIKNYLDSQKSPSSANSSMNAQQTADEALEVAAKSFLRPIVRAGLGILLFILLSIILKIVAALIDGAMKKTAGVKQVNALGGAVLSFAEIVIIIYVIVYVLSKYGFITAMEDQVANSYAIQLLLKFIPK